MQRVNGVIQHYPWGDHEAIPELLGREPDGTPQAELWFGTHPAGAARFDDGRSLDAELGQLPYLLKVLSAATPLSLQVHPSMIQAEQGFDREEAAGVPIDSPRRNYRDRMHKPELMYALTQFEAVCGIAPLAETAALLDELGPAAATMRSHLVHEGIDSVIGLILHDRPDLGPLLTAASPHPDPRCRWLARLADRYPGDPSAALLLILNYVDMQPGQAIFLGAGTVHAYLRGTGIEVMANSNNVLRCGLTDKPVDADEVLRILDDTPLEDPLVQATPTDDGGMSYGVPVDDFRITRYEVDGSVAWQADGVELVLCTDGETLDLSRGECAVARDGEKVELVGTATIFRIGGHHPTPSS